MPLYLIPYMAANVPASRPVWRHKIDPSDHLNFPAWTLSQRRQNIAGNIATNTLILHPYCANFGELDRDINGYFCEFESISQRKLLNYLNIYKIAPNDFK